MSRGSPFLNAFASELRQIVATPRVWLAALTPTAALLALMGFLERAPHSWGDNSWLDAVLRGVPAFALLSVLFFLPMVFVFDRAFGTRLRRVAGFLSSRPLGRSTAANARVAAAGVMSLVLSCIAIVWFAVVAPWTLQSEIPIVLYVDMLKAELAGHELAFPSESAATCFDEYRARYHLLPTGCRAFGVTVLEDQAPFEFLGSSEAKCLERWRTTEQGNESQCTLYPQMGRQSSYRVTLRENHRSCFEAWADDNYPKCSAVAQQILDNHPLAVSDRRSTRRADGTSIDRRPDPGSRVSDHWVTLVLGRESDVGCVEAWRKGYAPLRDACVATRFDRAQTDKRVGQELGNLYPRAFLRTLPRGVFFSIFLGLSAFFWSLFGAALGLSVRTPNTTIAGIVSGIGAFFVAGSLEGPMLWRLVLMGMLCGLAYGVVMLLWLRNDLGQ